MLLYPSMNELKDKADSRYTVVILTAKRARDIIAGKKVLTDFQAERPVTLAAHEIVEDLITYKRDETPEEETEKPASAVAVAAADIETDEEVGDDDENEDALEVSEAEADAAAAKEVEDFVETEEPDEVAEAAAEAIEEEAAEVEEAVEEAEEVAEGAADAE